MAGGIGRAHLGLRATSNISLVRMSDTSTSEFSFVSRSCATKLAAPRCGRTRLRCLRENINVAEGRGHTGCDT
jgi:hypothetical protein